MAYLLGIDIGTSGTKSLLCDDKGVILATATSEHGISQPHPGWSEQAPTEWWNATVSSVNAALSKAGISGKDVQGIGLSGVSSALTRAPSCAR